MSKNESRSYSARYAEIAPVNALPFRRFEFSILYLLCQLFSVYKFAGCLFQRFYYPFYINLIIREYWSKNRSKKSICFMKGVFLLEY